MSVCVCVHACLCMHVHVCERARRGLEKLNLLIDGIQICLAELKSNLVGSDAD